MQDLSDAFVKAVCGRRALQAQADTLRAFGSHRAATVLDVRADRGELLLERVTPGVPLAAIATEDEAMRVVAGLFAHGGWPPARQAAGTSIRDASPHVGGDASPHVGGDASPHVGGADPLALFARALDAGDPRLSRAAALLDELSQDEREIVLLHADLHYGNVLRSERAGWLLIDPKGALGPRAFDIGYLVSRPMPQALDRLALRRAIDRRLGFLPDALDLDRHRVAAYAYVAAALSFAWAVEDGDDSGDAFAEAMRVLGPES